MTLYNNGLSINDTKAKKKEKKRQKNYNLESFIVERIEDCGTI